MTGSALSGGGELHRSRISLSMTYWASANESQTEGVPYRHDKTVTTDRDCFSVKTIVWICRQKPRNRAESLVCIYTWDRGGICSRLLFSTLPGS